MSVFSEYERESWQKINRSKSAITFSSKTPINIKEATKTMININREGGVQKYLGLPDQIRRRKKGPFHLSGGHDKAKRCQMVHMVPVQGKKVVDSSSYVYSYL